MQMRPILLMTSRLQWLLSPASFSHQPLNASEVALWWSLCFRLPPPPLPRAMFAAIAVLLFVTVFWRLWEIAATLVTTPDLELQWRDKQASKGCGGKLPRRAHSSHRTCGVPALQQQLDRGFRSCLCFSLWRYSFLWKVYLWAKTQGH